MWKERRPDSSTARGGMYGSILTALRRWLTSSIGWRRGCPGERCSKPTDSRLESHAHAALGAEARPDDRADERLFGYRLNRPSGFVNLNWPRCSPLTWPRLGGALSGSSPLIWPRCLLVRSGWHCFAGVWSGAG